MPLKTMAFALSSDHIDWLKKVGKETRVSTSEALRMVIDWAATYNPQEFKVKLSKAKLSVLLAEATRKADEAAKAKESIEAQLAKL